MLPDGYVYVTLVLSELEIEPDDTVAVSPSVVFWIVPEMAPTVDIVMDAVPLSPVESIHEPLQLPAFLLLP